MSSRDVISLIGNIRERAHRFIQGELNARGLHGVTPSHGATLSALFHRDEMTMSELSETIHRDRSTVTTLVRKLVRSGVISGEQTAKRAARAARLGSLLARMGQPREEQAA